MAQAAIAIRAKSAEAFRTISEVADDLDVPQHVLRFWEARFSQIRPVKRAGGRRYYRPDDIDLLRGIKALLYTEGFTIKGVQKVLRDRGLKHVMAIGQSKTAYAPASPPPAPVAAPPAPVAETKVTAFRPRVIKPKSMSSARALDQFDMFSAGSPPEKMAAEIERAYRPKPAAKTAPAPVSAETLAGQERAQLQTVLEELLELKSRLKSRLKNRSRRD